MKTFFAKAAVLTVALLLGNNALAENNNFWVGAKAGTLGFGLEGSWRALPWLDVRAGANRFDYDDTGSQAGINYDATLALDTYYATANFRFPMSPFRVTAGAFSNGNEVQLVGQPIGTVEIGGEFYDDTDVGTLRSTTSFESVAPYLGAGFDFSIADRFGIALDFGVLWQGDPIVTLTSDGTLASDPDFLAALETERQELVSEAENLKAYPVVSLGFNFNF